MADQNASQGRRPHFHRGRRGPDRRGGDRRTPQHAQEQPPPARDHVDIEQIVRDIRARISQRHGIELSNQQIQELAARRLEAILEPRTGKPALFEQLRRSAAEPAGAAPPADLGEPFDEQALYDSDGGFLRAIRRLLRPILKLFINPAPLAAALARQSTINADAAARDAARDRTQAEWNALHYEILQRLVTEISRVSIEMQSLSMRVEALGAKVDFNERRVRSFEQTTHQGRPVQPRSTETSAAQGSEAAPAEGAQGGASDGEGSRRRRRRRRGRRGGGGGEGTTSAAEPVQGAQDVDDVEGDEGEDADVEAVIESAEAQSVVSHEPAIAISPLQPTEPLASSSETSHAPAPPPAPDTAVQAAPPEPALPTQPGPPRDEPLPPAPVDHADPGPTDR